MLEQLKKEVCEANLSLVKLNLVIFTWGNVSAYDYDSGYVVIKPSGVDYSTMQYEDMVVVDLDGNVIEGQYNPSSDTKTHLEIYKNFEGVRSVVHTHSKWATIFAQASRDVKVLGTTHADYFYGDIPCTASLSEKQVNGDYEKETGTQIISTYNDRQLNYNETPGILVANHGPFTWGGSCKKAVENAAVLEYISEMAYHSYALNKSAQIPSYIVNKHYLRKHGSNAYYGQKKKGDY